jgi:hypothetical protein
MNINAIRFRGCCRCGGDLFLDRDEDGEFFYCLQCGAISTVRGPDKDQLKVAAAPAGQSSADSPVVDSRSRSQRLISSRAGGAT